MACYLMNRLGTTCEHLKHFASLLMEHICMSLDNVCVKCNSSVAAGTLLRTQLRGAKRHRRLDAGARIALAQKRDPGAILRDLESDGINIHSQKKVKICDEACRRYFAKTKVAFKESKVLELLLDASRYGGRHTEIVIAYGVDSGVAAYAAPQVAVLVYF